jgi:metallo-beta-lactamase class B
VGECGGWWGKNFSSDFVAGWVGCYNRRIMIFRSLLLALLVMLPMRAQNLASMMEEWRKPFPAHRVVGNVYYVGTNDLACFLIATPEGHMLVNTGLADSVPMIQKSIESLGFRFEDVKILLTTQVHFDHVAAMQEIKKLTGAKMLATAGDAPVLEDGGKSDYHLGKDYWFAPVKVDGVLQDGQKITLGKTEVTVLLHPGHTKGSVSYSLAIPEGGKTYRVLIANMGSINSGVALVGNKKYPAIAEDYARTFKSQKSLECDVFLASHASQYRLHEKYKPGAEYKPETFVDPAGYRRAVENAEASYLEQLARDQKKGR